MSELSEEDNCWSSACRWRVSEERTSCGWCSKASAFCKETKYSSVFCVLCCAAECSAVSSTDCVSSESLLFFCVSRVSVSALLSDRSLDGNSVSFSSACAIRCSMSLFLASLSSCSVLRSLSVCESCEMSGRVSSATCSAHKCVLQLSQRT